jgi:HSP20 family protein
MNLMKYDPFVSSRSLSNFFDSFFNRDIGDVVGSDFVLSHPSVNVVEQENAFLLELAAPGLKKNDFNVNVEKDTLTISAEKEMKTEMENSPSANSTTAASGVCSICLMLSTATRSLRIMRTAS